jgi:hypothetical protein
MTTSLSQEFESFPTDFARIDEVGLVVMTVPKAAHTSIMSALAATFARPGETHKDATKRWRSHKSPTFPSDYLAVGFCRHPLDRFRSCWQDKIANVDVCRTELAAIGCKPRISLDKFSALVVATEDRHMDKHLTPQHYKFFADGKPRVQAMFRFEELISSWAAFRDEVRAHCGRSLAPLPVLNASRPAPYQWSERSRQKVCDRYSRDLSLLGYE